MVEGEVFYHDRAGLGKGFSWAGDSQASIFLPSWDEG